METYGFEGAAYGGERLQVNAQGASFTFQGQPVSLPRAARAQAEAAVLGLTLAQRARLNLEEAAERLSSVSVPGGRYRVLPGRFTIIDDTYNASPLSMKAALDALSAYPGRKVSVLGRMLELGENEQAMHADVGEYARQKADVTYGVGQFAALLGERAYASVPEVLEALRADLRGGDVVLLKASRGIAWTPERRGQEGVGLDSLVRALLAMRGEG